jgi:hypothetical protein
MPVSTLLLEEALQYQERGKTNDYRNGKNMEVVLA